MTFNVDSINLILGIVATVFGSGGLLAAILTRKKTKAETTNIISKAAETATKIANEQADRMKDEAEKWKTECSGLRLELDEVKEKLSEQESCQTTLKVQIFKLENEKQALIIKVERLQARITALEDENQRLKEEV